MIKRVYKRAMKASLLDEVFVATDSQKIQSFCKRHRMPCLLSSDKLLTGTDRVAAVAPAIENKANDTRVFVNIQGDEPLIHASDINLVATKVLEGAAVVVGVKDDLNEEDKDNGFITKAAVSLSNRLLLMYRFGPGNYYGSVRRGAGLYAFRESALLAFGGWEQSPLEKLTGVEVVRFLEHDYVVRAVELDGTTIAVDEPEDVQRVEEYLSKQKGSSK